MHGGICTIPEIHECVEVQGPVVSADRPVDAKLQSYSVVESLGGDGAATGAVR